MDPEARAILTEVGLPDHITSLLDLYGIRTLKDLTSFDSAIIEEVESCVKNGTFEGIVDLEDKNNRLKYLGFDYKSIDSFKFLPMDTMKMLKVPELVKKSLESAANKLLAPPPAGNFKVEPDDDNSLPKTFQAAKSIMLKVQSLFERLDLKEDDADFDFNFTHSQTFDNVVIQISCPKSKFSSFDGCNRQGNETDTDIDVLPLEVKIEKIEEDPIQYNDYYQPEEVNFADYSHLGNLGYEMNHVADEEKSDDPQPKKKNSKFHIPPKVRHKKNLPSSEGKTGKVDLDAGLIIKYIDGVKFYECEICGKNSFMQRRKMKQHRLIHTTERNFICHICSYAAKTKGSLQSHISTVHREKNLICDICGIRYKYKPELRNHITAVHLKETPHTCHVCGKSFTRATSLKHHIEFHFPVKKVECQICGFKMMNSSKLKRHMKSHSGERNYECDLCGKKFLYSYNVTAHKKHVHFGEKREAPSEERLTCYICYKRFPRIWKVKEHMQEVHGVMPAAVDP